MLIGRAKGSVRSRPCDVQQKKTFHEAHVIAPIILRVSRLCVSSYIRDDVCIFCIYSRIRVFLLADLITKLFLTTGNTSEHSLPSDWCLRRKLRYRKAEVLRLRYRRSALPCEVALPQKCVAAEVALPRKLRCRKPDTAEDVNE